MDGSQASKVGKTSIESDEHTSECMWREQVDHPGSNEEHPTRKDVAEQRSNENDPGLKWKDYQKIQVYEDYQHNAKEDCSGLPAYKIGPTRVVKSHDNDRKNDDISYCILGVPRETSLNEVVIIERGEKVEALLVEQEINT